MYIFETILKRSTKTLTVEYNNKYQVNVHIPTYWTSLCLWCSCGYAHCSECKPRLVSWSLWVHLIPATMVFCPLNPPWHDMAATHYCHAGSTTAWEPSWCAAQRFVRQKRRKILCELSLNLEQLMVSKLRWKCFKWQGHKLPMFANMWIARHVQLPVVWARPWKMSNVHLLCRKHFRKCNVAKVSVESCRCSVLHTPDLFKDNRVSQLWAQHF